MTRLGLVLVFAATLAATPAVAQTPPTTPPPAPAATGTPAPAPPPPAAVPAAPDAAPLRVGVVQAPPFAYLDSDGTWTGLAVVLWRVIAGNIERKWDWVEVETAAGYAQLAQGGIDVMIGPVAITAERSRTVDFSAPFLSSELGVTVSRGDGLDVLTAARRIFTRHLLVILLGLGLSITLAGILMWAFERRSNPGHFGGPAYEGIGAGIWWAAVTMTTVGYGDTLPRTRGGRVIALIWMFISIVVISLFTASVVSMVTLANLHSRVENVEDLRRMRVGAVDGGTGQDFLRHHAVPVAAYPTMERALQGIVDAEVDAVVGEVPVMRWLVRREWSDQLLVTAPFLEQEFYAVGLAPRDDLRKTVNAALLHIIETDDWRAVRERYLGH